MAFGKASWIAASLAVALLQMTPAQAETFNTCAGFIDSVPATISSQGVWCLKKDLATSITIGRAITIAANNVTVDCNGFKIGGLAAGTDSLAAGIYADGTRQNATVRNCNVRGFGYGIQLEGSGLLVEDNRVDQSLHIGIWVGWLGSENNRVQRNAVYDTGGATTNSHSTWGIWTVGADVGENTVAGMFADAPNGIQATSGDVGGNRVRDIRANVFGIAYGIRTEGTGYVIEDNRVSAETAISGYGISNGYINTFCIGNTVVNYSDPYSGCSVGDGNSSFPVVR